jgi:CheY-like chemotaxis protein
MPASKPAHLLIVEDEGDLLEVLKFVLEDAGYRISTAQDGAAALAIAASGKVSLVLLDVGMPGVDGIEVARRLRADPTTANVRLALHTGLTAAAAVRERFTDYDAFIPKAEDAEELIAAIKAAIEKPPRSSSAPRACDRRGLTPSGRRTSSSAAADASACSPSSSTRTCPGSPAPVPWFARNPPDWCFHSTA